MNLTLAEAKEKLAVVDALPSAWSAESFTQEGYQRVEGLLGSYRHIRVPGLYDVPQGLKERKSAEAQMKHTEGRQIDARTAMRLRAELDTTLALKSRIIAFAAYMSIKGAMQYNDLLSEFYETYLLGNESNPDHHVVTIDSGGQVVWRQEHQLSEDPEVGTERWRQMRLLPGSSRIFREMSIVGVQCIQSAEIIGAEAMTTRHCGFMKSIEWRLDTNRTVTFDEQPA